MHYITPEREIITFVDLLRRFPKQVVSNNS